MLVSGQASLNRLVEAAVKKKNALMKKQMVFRMLMMLYPELHESKVSLTTMRGPCYVKEEEMKGTIATSDALIGGDSKIGVVAVNVLSGAN